MAWCFCESDVAGDNGFENLPGKVAMDFVPDLLGHTRSAIEHRQHDAFDAEARIEPLPDQFDCPKQVREAFERVELALQWDEYLVRRNQGIDREKSQGRGAVDEHISIGAGGAGHRRQGAREAMLAALDCDELDLRPYEVDIRGQEVEAGQGGLDDGFFRRLAPEQGVVHGRVQTFFLYPEPGRRISLRIQIGEKSGVTRESETSRQIDRRRGFPYAALLIHDGERLSQQDLHVPRQT